MQYLTKWLNYLVKIVGIIFIVTNATKINAQDISHLSIDEANQFARQNYPIIKQKDLIKQTANLNIENLSKGLLPQFTVGSEATYQSDVIKLNVPLPGFKIEPLAKDQYKIFADVNQLIYDGGVIKQENELQQLNSEVEQQKIEVELYKLKERVNQVYLGILYLDAQKQEADLIIKDIQIGITNMEAQVQNGTAFRSNLNILNFLIK